LCAEGDAADLLAGVKARGGHACHIATVADDGSGEGPSGLGEDHAVAPAIEIDGGNVTIEIEITASENAIHVLAEGILVTGERGGEELDSLVGLVFDGSDVAAIESEDGLAIRVVAIGASPVCDDKVSPVFATPIVAVVTEVDNGGGTADGYVGGDDGAESYLVESVGLRSAEELRACGAGGVGLTGENNSLGGGAIELAVEEIDDGGAVVGGVAAEYQGTLANADVVAGAVHGREVEGIGEQIGIGGAGDRGGNQPLHDVTQHAGIFHRDKRTLGSIRRQ